MRFVVWVVTFFCLLPLSSIAGEPWQDPEVRQLRYLFEKGHRPSRDELRIGTSWRCATHWASQDHGGTLQSAEYYQFVETGKRGVLRNRGDLQAPYFRWGHRGEFLGRYYDGENVFGTDVIRVNRYARDELIVEFFGAPTWFPPLYWGVVLGLYGVDPVSAAGMGSVVVAYRLCHLNPES